MSLEEYIAEKLGKSEELDPVTIKGLRMLNVKQLLGAYRYLADGVLGLVYRFFSNKGFGFAETDEDDSEPDTDFLEKLITQQTSL